MDENVFEHRVPILSRKAKAVSAVLVDSVNEESRWSPSRKARASRRNHNSLPADLAYPFDDTDLSFELSCCVTEEDENASSMSPMSKIASFRKGLELLKAGCVSECSTLLSPSPDFMLMDNFSSSSQLPPLPVDEPFKILSSSSHVVLPMEEYSIQVPIVEPDSQLDVIQKIETQFSMNDFNMFTDDTFSDHNDHEQLQSRVWSHDSTSSSSHLDTSVSSKGISRQDSLEYDHLEPGIEATSAVNPTSNNCSVTVQFHEISETVECTVPEHTRKVSYSASNQEEIVSNDVIIYKRNTDASNHFLAFKPSSRRCPLKGLGIVSSSIPEKLNTLHLKNSLASYTNVPSHSSSGIHCSDEDFDKCHCPVCCACGSSQRQLFDIVSQGRKNSSVSQKYYDETLSNASWPAFPQEKHSTIIPKTREHLTPSIAVSQGVSKRIDNVSSGKDGVGNGFGPSVEISHSNSVIEDELEISSNYGNHVWCEADNQSMFSIHSLMSCQSGLTYNSGQSYCSYNQPFNKGVEGLVFKERIEVRSLHNHLMHVVMFTLCKMYFEQ